LPLTYQLGEPFKLFLASGRHGATIEMPNRGFACFGGWALQGRHNQRAFASLIAAYALFQTTAASAQDSMADPAGSGAIVSAVRWLQGTLLGTVATVVAIVAVATVGMLMLTGRINWRYGVTVILGCFILFGAASIVAGIHSTATLAN
jgi:type IV secretion system protein VirB2